MISDFILRLANILHISNSCHVFQPEFRSKHSRDTISFFFHIHAQLNIQLRFQVTVLKIVPGAHRAPSCKPKTFSWQLKLGHGTKNGLQLTVTTIYYQWGVRHLLYINKCGILGAKWLLPRLPVHLHECIPPLATLDLYPDCCCLKRE